MLLFILLNIVSFLNTLLIILVIWYGFKLVVRLIAPKVIEKAAEKIVRDMNQRQNMQARPGTKNGDVTVERTEKKSKQYQRNDGEYIDFEEIK